VSPFLQRRRQAKLFRYLPGLSGVSLYLSFETSRMRCSFSRTFRTYIIFAVTYSVVYSVLFTKLDEAWSVAKSRYHLAANPDSTSRGVLPRLRKRFWWFVSVLGRSIEYVGDLIYSLVHERGFFRERSRDAHIFHFGKGDAVATILLTMIAVIAIVIAIPERSATDIHGPPTTSTPVTPK